MNRGTSRHSRKIEALEANHISIDERTLLDRIIFTLKFAEKVKYYGLQNKVTGNWKRLLEGDPAFIIAEIANTELIERKIQLQKKISSFKDTESLQINASYKKEITHMKESSMEWSQRLGNAGYRGPLSKEIKSFVESLSDPKQIEEQEDGEAKFNEVFGNMLFIKEKAIRNFEKEILLTNNHHPHIGLLLAFFKLFNLVQQELNTFTKRHLTYFYNDLLQQLKITTGSKSALLALELQKGEEQIVVEEGEEFLFTLEDNREVSFEASTNFELNTAYVSDIKTIYKQRISVYGKTPEGETFTTQTILSSDVLTDGINFTPTAEEQKINLPSVFGVPEYSKMGSPGAIDVSDLGFVISSPSLMLENGSQTINLIFNFTRRSFKDSQNIFDNWDWKKRQSNNDHQSNVRPLNFPDIFKKGFRLFISEEEGWRQLDNIRITLNDETNRLEVSFDLLEHHEKLVPYQNEIHGGDFKTAWPCIKLLLNNNAVIHPYKFLEPLILESIEIKADVSGVTNFELSNSTGDLDSSIPFTPFGPSPYVGSYLRIVNPLIFQRHLFKLQVTLDWNGLPHQANGFADHYRAYGMGIRNDIFKAAISDTRILDPANSRINYQDFELFDMGPAERSSLRSIDVDLEKLNFSNKIDFPTTGRTEQPTPMYFVLSEPEMAFGHQIFAEIYSEMAIKRSRFRRKSIELPKQPYTPVLEQMRVEYSNSAKEIMLRKRDEESSNIKLIHLFPFGHVQQFPAPIKSAAHFIPQIEYKGNLLLGLKGVKPFYTVNIGFDMEPAVYEHTTLTIPKIVWQYLINNEWTDFGELVLQDNTDGLIKSGVVKLMMPNTLQRKNTRLESDRFWIRAVSLGDDDLTSRIKSVFTQAISVICKEDTSENKPLSKFKAEIKSIKAAKDQNSKKVIGLFDLTSGNTSDNEERYFMRVSERLRHKNRAVSTWDLEHLLIERFGEIEKVKAYGRSGHNGELVKGSSVQVVVIPSAGNQSRPGSRGRKLPVHTLEKIKAYLKNFISPYVQVEVSNAVYELVKVRCYIVLRDHSKRGHFRDRLNYELIELLSPHIRCDWRDLGFDDTISKAEILNFIESREYVASVEKLSIFQLIKVGKKYKIIDSDRDSSAKVLKTNLPYAVLGSVPQHLIRIVSRAKNEIPELAYIDDLSVDSDFIISDTSTK